jgi:hypothetical protein
LLLPLDRAIDSSLVGASARFPKYGPLSEDQTITYLRFLAGGVVVVHISSSLGRQLSLRIKHPYNGPFGGTEPCIFLSPAELLLAFFSSSLFHQQKIFIANLFSNVYLQFELVNFELIIMTLSIFLIAFWTLSISLSSLLISLVPCFRVLLNQANCEVLSLHSTEDEHVLMQAFNQKGLVESCCTYCPKRF